MRTHATDVKLVKNKVIVLLMFLFMAGYYSNWCAIPLFTVS
jgi:hypothetical protein